MNYFRPYSLSADETIVAAWDSQVVQAAETPWLAEALATQSADLFPRFAACYAELRALPRGARRALQRQLARSREVALPSAWQQKLAHSLAGAALLLALGGGAAEAALIVVNTSNPAINVGDGKCSLIEAIVNANNDDSSGSFECASGSGADKIQLPKKSTHVLTAVYTTYYDYTGLPVITSQITIQGNGAKITRKKNAPDFGLVAVSYSGDLTLQNLTLRGGQTPNFSISGGGVFNGGTLTIANSTISGNTGHFGGGVRNTGTLTIENSTISGNIYGGVVNSHGALTIANSTISGNTAGAGGGVYNSGTLTIENSTISGNTATFGGGVYNRNGFLTIENSTISGNTAAFGGGVLNGGPNGGTLTIENSTISGNTAVGAVAGASYGGGVESYGTLILNRSLISGNQAVTEPEIYHYGSVTADNFNLFGTNGSSGVTGFAPGPSDIVPGVALSKILGSLQNNGGPTKTHKLVNGSPAIDAIPLADPGCTGTDQRGITRPQGAGCDIGAFEK